MQQTITANPATDILNTEGNYPHNSVCPISLELQSELKEDATEQHSHQRAPEQPSGMQQPQHTTANSVNEILNTEVKCLHDSVCPISLEKEDATEHLLTVTLNMSGDVLFAFDWRKKLPVLIDTGASVSLIPLHLCEEFDTDETIALSGVVGSSNTLGSVTYVPEMGFKDRSPHKFYVANVNLNFMIAGMDFLTKHQLSIHPHLQLLTQNHTGELVKLTKALGSNPLETFWENFLNPVTLSKPAMITITSADSSTSAIVIHCHKILQSFPDILREPDYSGPPKHKHVLDIIVICGFKFIANPPRRCSMFNQEVIDNKFSEQVRKGALIRKSSSNTSPVTLATKKDGSPRVCVDYTKLNNQTVTLHYPLPLIQSLDQRITSRHCYFSSLDLREAYCSLPLSERAQQLAAITTLHGVYQPLRCPFGLKNAPAKFSELIADVISGLEKFVFAYLDDFLVYSETLDDHYKHLTLLCERLDKFGLFVNLEKCQFAQRSIEFLGHRISDQGMTPLTSKVSAIVESKRPTTLRELRSLLGSVNYYRKYIPHIAEMLGPLNGLLQGPKRGKNTKIPWEPKHETSFKQVISALVNFTCLTYEDPSLPLVLSTDASNDAAGAVLEQNFGSEDDPSFRPLAFFSKSFPATTVLRSTFNRELTAMYLAVKHFRHRILGRPIIIRTDHLALVRAMNNCGGEHSPNEARMLAYCKEFSPCITYITGEDNVVADWLSRPPSPTNPSDHVPDTSFPSSSPTSRIISPINDHNGVSCEPEASDAEVMCAPDNCTSTFALYPVLTTAPTMPMTDSQPFPMTAEDALTPGTFHLVQQREMSLIDSVRVSASQPNSSFCVTSRKVPGSPDALVYGTQEVDSNVFRPIVPTQLRVPVFHAFHTTAHLGSEKTTDLIASHYYWPGMMKDIGMWCRSCAKCQSCKVSRHNRARLVNYPANSERLQTVHLDLITLTHSEGNRYLLTMRDRGTGLICAAPLSNKTAESVKNAFLVHYIGHYGVPATVITDNGREFTAALFRDFCICCGIHQKFITAYHPQANGAVERIHRCIRTAFRALPDPSQWTSQLPFLILTLNNVTCDVNKYSSFQHTFGQAANLPGMLIFPADTPAETPIEWFHTAAFMEIMGHHRREARPLPNNRPYQESALDACTRVWVRNNAPDHSLSPLYKGPFEVVARYNKYFTIDCGGRLDNVSIDCLKVFHELSSPPSSAPLLPSPPSPSHTHTHTYNTRLNPRPDYSPLDD